MLMMQYTYTYVNNYSELKSTCISSDMLVLGVWLYKFIFCLHCNLNITMLFWLRLIHCALVLPLLFIY